MNHLEWKDLWLVVKNVKRRQRVFSRQVVVKTKNELIVPKRCGWRRDKLIIGLVRQRNVFSDIFRDHGIDGHLVIWEGGSIHRAVQLSAIFSCSRIDCARKQIAKATRPFGGTQSLKWRCKLPLTPSRTLIRSEKEHLIFYDW